MEKTIKACEDYIAFIRSNEFNEDRLERYENAIFEAAMNQTHGPEIWDEINARLGQ